MKEGCFTKAGLINSVILFFSSGIIFMIARLIYVFMETKIIMTAE
jgi:hypothetical protein